MFMPLDPPRHFPDSVLSAAAHSDPYPYYAALRAYRPIYREHRLGLWIAVGAQAVSEVLASPLCRVRPIAEPVPAAIAGAPAGSIFQQLVRMNDGPRHATMTAAVGACVASLEPAARREAAGLARELAGASPSRLDRFNF